MYILLSGNISLGDGSHALVSTLFLNTLKTLLSFLSIFTVRFSGCSQKAIKKKNLQALSNSPYAPDFDPIALIFAHKWHDS